MLCSRSMGCIGSHFLSSSSGGGVSSGDESYLNLVDINSRIFPVLNVDELGRHISPGKLEVSEVNLILHINGRTSLIWPLRSLRRYGYENELFSFEAGRRCPTGPGIYAFKCSSAQTLFELLQSKIQGAPGTNVGNIMLGNGGGETRVNSNLSPSSLSPTFDYVNICDSLLSSTDPNPSSKNNNQQAALYMNVESRSGKERRAFHYSNLDPNTKTELNYAELDLDEGGEESESVVTTRSKVEETKTELGYATIDFDRTAALKVVTRSKIKLDFTNSSRSEEEEVEIFMRKTSTTSTAI